MDLRQKGKTSSKGSNSRLSESRRVKMESIQQRENKKGDRRTVLSTMLVTKLVKKYNADSDFERVISTMVSKLVKSSGRITEADITALELSVKKMTKKDDLFPSLNESKKGSVSSSKSSRSGGRNDSLNNNETGLNASALLQSTNEWVLINALNSVEHENEEDAKSRKLRQEKTRQRNWLDSQLVEKREKVTAYKKEQIDAYKCQVDDLKKWRQEEEEKASRIVTAIKSIKVVRAEQLSERQKTQYDAIQAREVEEEAEVLRCQRLLKEEEEGVQKKRIDERERMRLVLIENQKVEVVKAARKVKDQEYDIKLMAEYAQKLAKEEQDRIDSFASKLRCQDEIHSGMGASTHEINRKRAQDDQNRAEEYQRKKVEGDIKREEEKNTRRKEEAISRKLYLDFQRQVKQDKKVVEHQEEHKYAVHYRQEGEEAQREEKLNIEGIRKRNKEYEKLLLSQMNEQHVHKAKAFSSMDASERRMNAQLLKKLEDTTLQDQVSAKISPEKRGKGAAHSNVF